jgi:hypothetical protein
MQKKRRHIEPNVDADVWCSGRWGPRRVRVAECWATLTAEDVYTALLRSRREALQPGVDGWHECTLTHRRTGLRRSVRVEWLIRANAVWRFGRVFLKCPKCRRLATRLYLPTADTPAWCRRCWGLSYDSRKANYRTGGFLGALLGSWAEGETILARERRRLASAARYAERQELRRTGQNRRSPH